MPRTFRNFLRHPLSTLRRAASKLLTGPLKYRRGTGYDARRYWSDRFGRYGMSLRGPGNEGLSNDENRRLYAVSYTHLRAHET